MENSENRCKGTTKKGKACNSHPLKGEEYCAKHHPSIKYKRWLEKSIIANIAQFAFAICLFFYGQYLGKKSTESIKQDIRQHSLAERILDSQYNLAELLDLIKETINLMNNDPSFKKTFYIDSKGIGIKTGLLIYGKDYNVDFSDSAAEREFQDYLNSGRKILLLDSKDYRYFYINKEGSKIDSFANASVEISRNFPTLPILNISTIDPTGEYLCASFVDIQIDSILGQVMYLSNSNQDITFKIKIQYDLKMDIGSFDQLEDMQFDNSSSFYSIDQEISYYKFLKALYSNARIRIRNAITGDSIKTTDHYLPVNMDGYRSYVSITNKLILLNELAMVQDRWGLAFNRSDITELELAYLRGIENSLTTASELTKAPLVFTLPRAEADKLIINRGNIGNRKTKIICDLNSIVLLDRVLPLDRMVIDLPPSNMVMKNDNDVSKILLTPRNKGDKIIYKFTDLERTGRPGNIIYGEYSPLKSDSTVIFVKGLILESESWINSKNSPEPLDFKE